MLFFPTLFCLNNISPLESSLTIIAINNNTGDNMKWKTILSAVFAIVVGFLMGKFMLNQYDSEYELAPVFNQNSDSYYFLRQGEYDSYEDMEKNMMGFDYYIYDYISIFFLCQLFS